MHKSSSGSTTVSTSGRSGRRFSVATCTSLQRRSVEEEHARIKSRRRRSVCFAAEAKNDDDVDVSDDTDDVFEAGSDYSGAEEETRIEIPENWRQNRRQTLPLPRVLPPLTLADRHESLPCLNEETDSAVALLRRKNSGSTTSRRASVPSVMIDFKVSSPRDEDDDDEEEIV